MRGCFSRGRGDDWTSVAWRRGKEEDGGWGAATAAADRCGISERWREFEMRQPLNYSFQILEDSIQTGSVKIELLRFKGSRARKS